MKRKTTLALLFCVLSAMILVGCEQKTDTSTGTSTNAAPATPSTNAPAK
ncbi:hypothetical protein [Pedosphaera parvula]|nr:hypothetical protein [Pedosphaera parvula]